MHLSIIPPGPNTSAMLGEGVGDAEALTEGVMHGSEVFAACYLNTMVAPTPGGAALRRLARRRAYRTMLHSERKGRRTIRRPPSLRTPEVIVQPPRSPPARIFRRLHRSKIVCFRW